MDIVLYTQRVEVVESYGERRDCADQNIARFIEACGYLGVPVPNIRKTAEQLLIQLRPVGIILTGGNSLAKYGGNAPERDEMEYNLVRLAIKRQIPIYGFCRGMQVLLDYFGCELVEVQRHVAVRHKLNGSLGEIEVNSFHNQACLHIQEPLQALAWADDGVIEAVACEEYHILATMWHPERESIFQEEDIIRIRNLFQKGEILNESDYFSRRAGNQIKTINRQLS
ncbi:MAG: gamma-glutamyl-gamma-aminobutyrate hydrolase family protein [Clostridium sp.]|nr:gamma-glutamyl-gamma-aminobutyrate hydrolase family protein [Clostridium sp.]